MSVRIWEGLWVLLVAVAVGLFLAAVVDLVTTVTS